MARSLGFGSMACNWCELAFAFALFRLGFPPAPGLPSLSLAAYHDSQAHSTKGTPSSNRSDFDMLRVYGFRFSFTPLAGVLFAFPSRYFCTIGRISCLALDRGRPRFRQGFSCPAVLRYRPTESLLFRVRGFHPLCQAFPKPFRYSKVFLLRPLRADGPSTPLLLAV